MPTYSKQRLSGATDGHVIDVQAVASPGDIIHTVGATATDGQDMPYLYAANSHATDHLLTIEYGGTATGNHIPLTLTARDGPNLIIPGWPLTATTSIVRAFATVTEGLRMGGYVNRAT